MSTLAKLGDKFNLVKQWTKEKVGKAEKTEESQAHLDTVARFKATKIELEEFQEAIRKWIKHQERALECFQTLSTATSKVTSANSSSTTVVQATVPLITEVHTAHSSVVNVVKSSLFDPLETLNQVEIKHIEKTLKRVDDARLNFDAKNAAWKSAMDAKTPKQSEIDQAKTKATEAESAYNQALHDFASECDHLEQRKQDVLVNGLPAFVNAQATFFANGTDSSRRFAAKLGSAPEEGKDTRF